MLQVRPDERRSITFHKYVSAIGKGEIVGRQDMADQFGVSYSTATYHLEKAVAEGLLNKQYGYLGGNQPGWLYALPATMPRLEGV